MISFAYNMTWVTSRALGYCPPMCVWLPPASKGHHTPACHWWLTGAITGRTTVCLLPLGAYVVPSSTLSNRSKQGSIYLGQFQLMGSWFEVPGVYQLGLIFHLWGLGQPMTTAIVYNTWGDSWTALANNSKEGFSCLGLGFLLGGLCGSWDQHCQPRWENFI